jgi:hypothetical protein
MKHRKYVAASRKSRKRRRNAKPRNSTQATARSQMAEVRGLAALNRVRRGEFKNLSNAARAERTTVRSIKKLLPKAITQDRPGARIRVKPRDPYSERVEIISANGAVDVTARGSRQRQLAGRHRATVFKVLRKELPPNALEEFRGVKVGGRELVSDYDQLRSLGEGILDQLGALYVAPEAGR